MKLDATYWHVPEVGWRKWKSATEPLYDRLRQPATIDELMEWCREIKLDVWRGKMSFAQRKTFVKNMLAWLSVAGRVVYKNGRWRWGSYYEGVGLPDRDLVRRICGTG